MANSLLSLLLFGTVVLCHKVLYPMALNGEILCGCTVELKRATQLSNTTEEVYVCVPECAFLCAGVI